MPAAFGSEEQHIRIGTDRRIAHRLEGNERVIFGVNDQRWNADPADEGPRAGFGLIVISVSKTKVRRDIAVVELLDAANATQDARIVTTRKQFVFKLDPVLQTAQKVLLINPVAPPGNQSRAGAQIN